eukprot:COSAG04_NODE_6334_length_1354_cov_1.098805_2_plen_72_part_01
MSPLELRGAAGAEDGAAAVGAGLPRPPREDSAAKDSAAEGSGAGMLYHRSAALPSQGGPRPPQQQASWVRRN